MAEKNIQITYNPLSGFKSFFHMITGIVSMMISWYFNQSVLWAIFHYIFGIPYLIYCLLLGRFKDGAFIEILSSYF